MNHDAFSFLPLALLLLFSPMKPMKDIGVYCEKEIATGEEGHREGRWRRGVRSEGTGETQTPLTNNRSQAQRGNSL